MKSLIIESTSEKAYNYFNEFINTEADGNLTMFTDNTFNILNNKNKIKNFINLNKVNDIRFINKFFELTNSKLELDSYFICCVETFTARKKRKKIGKIPIIRHIYFALEFIFMRVFPKLGGFKSIYFIITRGKNRLLSKAETLGRLVSCGFEIIDYKTINGMLFIVTKKKGKPRFDMNPSYGPIYKMPRVGKRKKIINVYKLRTMHPYSEYLQEYIFLKNGTSNGDKVNQDFRISPIGSFFRKFWIDELPMIINLVKGDLKIVGVRPLSLQKFNMYPKNVQELRTQFKPGLVPPFYADLPKSLDELIESEISYLNQYSKSPFLTDIKYFYKAFVNILFKGARSN